MSKALKTKKMLALIGRKIFDRPWDELDIDEIFFVRRHLGNLVDYKTAIAKVFLPMAKRNNFKEPENRVIESWYFAQIPLFTAIEGLYAGEKWAQDTDLPINSIKLFNSTVIATNTARIKAYTQMIVSVRDYTNEGKDPWWFEFWKTHKRTMDLLLGPE
ncbi:MAG: hypothetical protein GY765_11280 [bacterium]|nr:hypothetical protein [bacterium]